MPQGWRDSARSRRPPHPLAAWSRLQGIWRAQHPFFSVDSALSTTALMFATLPMFLRGYETPKSWILKGQTTEVEEREPHVSSVESVIKVYLGRFGCQLPGNFVRCLVGDARTSIFGPSALHRCSAQLESARRCRSVGTGHHKTSHRRDILRPPTSSSMHHGSRAHLLKIIEDACTAAALKEHEQQQAARALESASPLPDGVFDEDGGSDEDGIAGGRDGSRCGSRCGRRLHPCSSVEAHLKC